MLCFRGATSSSFRGMQFSWNFIRRRHRAYSTVVQRFRKPSQIKFSSQHFQNWELFSFNQDADRTMKRESKLIAFSKHLVPYSASEVMALVWQIFRLLVNLCNFSSCFSKFLKRGGEPAASVNIGYGPHQNFRYSI